METTMKPSRLLILMLAAATLAPQALAQSWPQKPVRLLVSFPAGAPGDMIARLIQPDLQKSLGQPVIVDNKPSAGGNIGAQEVARATDGHTFLVGPDTMLTINPHLYKKLSFKPVEDLVPLTQLASFNQMLVCHPSVGVKSVSELLAKARNQKMDYASGGPGVPGHMAMEMLLATSSVKMNHIPYRGPAPATQDVLASQVPCGFLAAPVVGPHAREGKLVALAVSGAKRSPGSPAVPTMVEAGIRGFDASFFEILAAPRGMPPEAMDRMQKAVVSALQQPEIRARLLAADLEPVANTPAEASARMRADNDKWGRLAGQIGLQLD
jgi:tripartite-type tricarboxylate transporter receptor subunit TctC